MPPRPQRIMTEFAGLYPDQDPGGGYIDEDKFAAITGQPAPQMNNIPIWAMKNPLTGATESGTGPTPDPSSFERFSGPGFKGSSIFDVPVPAAPFGSGSGNALTDYQNESKRLEQAGPLGHLGDPMRAENLLPSLGLARGGQQGGFGPASVPVVKHGPQPSPDQPGGQITAPGTPDFSGEEGRAKTLQLKGEYQKKAALGYQEDAAREGAKKELEARMQNVAQQHAWISSEEHRQEVENQELQKHHADLMQQYKDLQQMKVDPGRLFTGLDGGLAFMGAQLADSVWAGTSWLYGATPGQGGPNAVQKLIDFAHRDTELQLKQIDQGRANLNAGTQLLNERINQTKNRRAAALEMVMRKIEAGKMEADALAKDTQNQVEAEGYRGLKGALDMEQGKLMLDWVKEKKKDAQAAAAASIAAQKAQLEMQMKAAEFGLKTYEAETGRIKAMNEGDGGVGKLEQRLVQIPGTNRFVAAASPDAKAKIEASNGEFNTALLTLQQIAKDRQAMKDSVSNPLSTLAGPYHIAQTYKAHEKLKSTAADLKTQVKNAIAKSGASLTAREEALLDEQLGDLTNVLGPGQLASGTGDQALQIVADMIKRHQQGTAAGLSGPQFMYDQQGNLVRVGQGQPQQGPTSASGGTGLPPGFRLAAGQ